MFSLLMFLGVSSKVGAATITSLQTGNWASTTTWNGGVVPGSGDNVTIAPNHTVTIPVNTLAIIGESSTTPTTALNLGTNSRLVISGTLRIQGNALLGAHSILEVKGGGIFEFSSPAATRYKLNFLFQSNGAPWAKVLGSATSWSNPATIRTMPGNLGFNGVLGTSAGGIDSAIDLSYTKLENLGDANNYAIRDVNTLIFNHVLMTGSAGLRTANETGATVNINYLDQRFSLMSNFGFMDYLIAPDGSSIRNSVIISTVDYTNAVNYFIASNFTIADSIFGGDKIKLSQGSHNFNLTNVSWASPIPNNNYYLEWPANSSGVWNGGGVMIQDSTPNPHIVSEPDANSYAGSPNRVSNVVVDGPSSAGNGGDGDFYMPFGPHTLDHIIMTNNAGNVDDGLNGVNSTLTAEHITFRRSDNGTTQSSFALAEAAPGPNKIASIRDILFSQDYNSVGVALASGTYVKQSNMYLDYLWWDSPKLPGKDGKDKIVWNPGTNHNGSIEIPALSYARGSVTVSSVTDATHLVLSSTANISVGDWLFHISPSSQSSKRSALVLAIPSPGNVTIGKNEDGVDGLPLAVAGQTLSIRPNLWATGVYGDNGKGMHEYYGDPGFIAPTRLASTWDTSLGGPGTKAHARTELVKINGWDENGAPATWNPAYNFPAWLSYMRAGFTPTNPLLKGAVAGTPDGQDIGAVNVADIVPPTITLTQPLVSATVSGSSITLTATSSDNFDVAREGVQGVKFYYDDLSHQIGSEITATSSQNTYQTTWDASGVSSGTHTLFAVSRDLIGNTSTSSSVLITVSNLAVPGAPTSVSATAGNTQATVTFGAPTSDGGASITGYTVTSTPAGGTDIDAGTTALSHTVTGLANGTPYTFTVTATNSVGTSSPSLVSNFITPGNVPDAPTSVFATATDTSAVISFTTPASDGGSPITSYTVTSSPGGLTATGSTSPITVSGLTDGVTYTFTVTATNSVGTSAASSPSNSVVPTAFVSSTSPGAPTSVTATSTDSSASISFVPPVSNGGSSIISYTVTSSPGGLTATGSTSPITISGLTNGTLYTFTVTATNSVGTGPASSNSNTVVPSTIPGAPTNVSVMVQALVTFSPPVSDGGSAITGYTVTSSPAGGIDTNAGSLSLSHVVTGLTNGTLYTFNVTATNSTGTGLASPNSSAAVSKLGT